MKVKIREDIVELGVNEFRKGLDYLEKGREQREKYNSLISQKKLPGKMPSEIKQIERDIKFYGDLFAGNIAMSIDIMLKAMVYLFVPDTIPETHHNQLENVDYLTSNYDIAPEIKDIDDVLNDIRYNASRTINNFIRDARYEGIRVLDERKVMMIINIAKSLEAFGLKNGLTNFDSYMQKFQYN